MKRCICCHRAVRLSAGRLVCGSCGAHCCILYVVCRVPLER